MNTAQVSSLNSTPAVTAAGAPFWTREREELLRDMWNVKEMTPRAIAEVLGCGRNAVIGKAHRLHLNKRENPVKQYLTKEQRHARKLEKARKKAQRVQVQKERLASGGVLMEDLDEHHCRFPIGDPDEEGFHFCGADRMPGSSYCEFHRAKCTRGRGLSSQGPQGVSQQRVNNARAFVRLWMDSGIADATATQLARVAHISIKAVRARLSACEDLGFTIIDQTIHPTEYSLTDEAREAASEAR